jgi:hypothetical protein
MDVEDHVRGVETYRCVWVRREIIEKLLHFHHCILCPFYLLARNSAQSHEDGEVDGAAII